MSKRISFVLLSTAVVLVSTLLAYFFSGGLFVLLTSVFRLKGVPEIVAPAVVTGGSLLGCVFGMLWARAMAK